MVEGKQDRFVVVFGITKDKSSLYSLGKSVTLSADSLTVVYVPLVSLLNRCSLLFAILV